MVLSMRFIYKKIAWASLLTSLLLVQGAVANQLTASVDRNAVGLQETLTLIITADAQTNSEPDLSELKNDFDVLSNSRSQSIRIINGNTESSTDWNITLAPKHAGKLLIPSFKIEHAVSDAIEINVSKKSQISTNNSEPVKVNIESDKDTAFVQEQILLNIILTTQVNLNHAELQPLEIKNALVVSLGQKQYQTTVNGKAQLVVEDSYAVFPQESGTLTIPSLTYTVAVDSARDMWNDPFGRRSNNLLRLRTDEKEIKINPATTQQGVKNWQPTHKLTLNEGWSGDTDHLNVGEPITRTITIMADSLTGGQIAPLPSQTIDGLTFYPDQPQTKDDKSNRGIRGTRTETTAIIPNKVGSFTLPAVTVHWWNTDTQTFETATLPEKMLTVIGGGKQQSNSVSTIPPETTNRPAELNSPAPLASPQQNSSSYSIVLLISNIIFIVISIGLAVYVYQLQSALKQLREQNNKTNNLKTEKEKHIWDMLKHAATTKDAIALRKAIIAWAAFQWPNAQLHSLDDVAKLANTIEITRALKILDELLYSAHPSQDWEPIQLLKLLNECRKEKRINKKEAPLQPLYKI